MRVLLVSCAIVSAAAAAPLELVSGGNRTHVVELFTSEGCSSCPPAEAWLSALRQDPRLWRDLVPIAWHVDYWDRLGWKDRFASKTATKREYDYAASWQDHTVYTPCLVVDGTASKWRQLPAISTQAVGVLRATCDGGRVKVAFEPGERDDYEVHAVRLALGVTSNVRAGENAGKTLRHDFIAAGAPVSARLDNGVATLDLAATKADDAPQHALAVWITRRGDLSPIQAVGGILTD
jgi:hypothetical protein